MARFTKILCPLDASELSAKAIDVSLALASTMGAQVWFLGVRPAGAEEHDSNEQVKQAFDSIDREDDALHSMVRERFTDSLPVNLDLLHTEVRSGPLVSTIVAAADEHMVDLIVMGTHGRHGLLEAFTGSSTEQVMAKTSASVLVVKPEGFPYLRD